MTEKGPNGYFIRMTKSGNAIHSITLSEDYYVCEEVLIDPLNKGGKAELIPVPRIEGDIVDRLSAYEDLGLDPEMIAEMRNDAAQMHQELRKWRELEKAGRIVVMPDPKKMPVLEAGPPVWSVDRESGEIESGKIFNAFYEDGTLDSFSIDFDSGDLDVFFASAWGTCVFGSREQAMAAIICKNGTGGEGGSGLQSAPEKGEALEQPE